MIQDAKEIFREYLSDRGINASKQRNIILGQFIDLDRQVDANELFFVLHTRNLKVRHATIYSAVKLFVESGIAREIHLGDGVIRYERATQMGRHEAPRPLGRAQLPNRREGAIAQLQYGVTQKMHSSWNLEGV